jgi:hypothetical protein
MSSLLLFFLAVNLYIWSRAACVAIFHRHSSMG